MTLSVVSTWLAWGTRQAATGLRSVADLVDSLADGLDGEPERVLRVVAPSENGFHGAEDDSRPLSGTRERIAVTLDRARERYDATLAAGSDPTTKRRNS